MKKFELIGFADGGELARAAAAGWLKEVQTANRRGAPHLVALSGGRIAGRFFATAAELALARGVSFANVHFFWADERCVPPDHAESNFALAKRLLFEPLRVATDRIHRIAGEAEAGAAAQAATAELTRVAPCNKAGQPVLDIVQLGMGEDGHVASLFPGETKAVREDPAVYRAVTAPKPPPKRVTIGYSTIAAARRVWVLVSGPGKGPALVESLCLSGGTPLAQVLRERRATKIFIDAPSCQ